MEIQYQGANEDRDIMAMRKVTLLEEEIQMAKKGSKEWATMHVPTGTVGMLDLIAESQRPPNFTEHHGTNGVLPETQ